MKNARQLLEEFTASSFRDPKKAAEMFSEDGAFEMPYLDSVGFPWRYAGREKVEAFFKFVRDLYPDMDSHDVKVVCETPDVVVAGRTTLAHQDQIGILQFPFNEQRGKCVSNACLGRNAPERGRSTRACYRFLFVQVVHQWP